MSVWDDISDTIEESENLKVRAKFMRAIRKEISNRGWEQADAVSHLGDWKKWSTRDEARKAVARWIEIVYNRRRRHSAIGMISPVDFEARIAEKDDRKKAAA